eukprot:781088-Pyramimonas_sp.AAC.1
MATVTQLQSRVKETESGSAGEIERLRKECEEAKTATKTKINKLSTAERELEKAKRSLDAFEADKVKRAEETAELNNQ